MLLFNFIKFEFQPQILAVKYYLKKKYFNINIFNNQNKSGRTDTTMVYTFFKIYIIIRKTNVFSNHEKSQCF